MQRGVDKQLIVRDDQDRLTLIELLAKAVIEHRWSLTAYCLMDNHLHALIRTRKPNLAVGMKLFQQTYVRRFNDRHRRIGPLFQGRYKAMFSPERAPHRHPPVHPAEPSRHGACDHPAGWRWSSYRATIGRGRPPGFVDSTPSSRSSTTASRATAASSSSASRTPRPAAGAHRGPPPAGRHPRRTRVRLLAAAYRRELGLHHRLAADPSARCVDATGGSRARVCRLTNRRR